MAETEREIKKVHLLLFHVYIMSCFMRKSLLFLAHLSQRLTGELIG